VLETIAAQTRAVLERVRAEDEALKALEKSRGRDYGKSPEMFELAKNYCALHAAASCVHTWLHNRRALGPFFARGEWLALALERLLRPLEGGRAARLPASWAESAAEELSRLFREDRLFSFVPLRLARGAEGAGEVAEPEEAASLPV
jgi:hypothetical protein